MHFNLTFEVMVTLQNIIHTGKYYLFLSAGEWSHVAKSMTSMATATWQHAQGYPTRGLWKLWKYVNCEEYEIVSVIVMSIVVLVITDIIMMTMIMIMIIMIIAIPRTMLKSANDNISDRYNANSTIKSINRNDRE